MDPKSPVEAWHILGALHMFKPSLTKTHSPSSYMLFLPLLNHRKFMQIFSGIQRLRCTFAGLTSDDGHDHGCYSLGTYCAMYFSI